MNKMDTFSSVQKLLGRILVSEQEHVLQPEHLQLDDVRGGHGGQDCRGAGVRQSRRLPGVLLQKCLKHKILKNMYVFRWNEIVWNVTGEVTEGTVNIEDELCHT